MANKYDEMELYDEKHEKLASALQRALTRVA